MGMAEESQRQIIRKQKEAYKRGGTELNRFRLFMGISQRQLRLGQSILTVIFFKSLSSLEFPAIIS